MKPLVIYHANCWDGFCAAWVARMALGEIDAVPYHYGQSPPEVRGRDTYVLDFSFPRAVLLNMRAAATSLLVLDHHKTAQADLAGLDFCLFNMDKSGGRLAWEHFAHAFIGGWEGMQAPWLVDYTEDHDLWRHTLPESENINAALRSYPLNFTLWDEFHHSIGQREVFKREGAAIRRAERAIVDTHVRNAREREMDGYQILAVNATVLCAEIAKHLAKGRPFGACYFDRQDGKRQWSLRSDDNGVDVSAVAKAHGGGGHSHAAEFEETWRVYESHMDNR